MNIPAWEKEFEKAFLEMKISDNFPPRGEKQIEMLKMCWEMIAPGLLKQFIPHVKALRTQAIRETCEEMCNLGLPDDCRESNDFLWKKALLAKKEEILKSL